MGRKVPKFLEQCRASCGRLGVDLACRMGMRAPD